MKFRTLITAFCLIFVWVGVSFAGGTEIKVINKCTIYEGDADVHLIRMERTSDGEEWCSYSNAGKGISPKGGDATWGYIYGGGPGVAKWYGCDMVLSYGTCTK